MAETVTNGYSSVPPAPSPPLDSTDPVPPPPSTDLPPPPPPNTDVAPPPPTIYQEHDEDVGPYLKPVKKAKKGWETKPKSQPLSIEELVKKKREAEEAASRPKFISRAERERIALEKRQAEVAVQKGSNGHVNGHMDIDRPIPSGPRDGSVPTGPRNARQDLKPPPAPKPIAFGASDSLPRKRQEREDDTAASQAALLRERYMGTETNMSTFSAQKKRKRTTEKKFNFEWDADQDTTPDYDPIYRNRTENNFYGRGRLAGFDDTLTDKAAQRYAAAIQARDVEAGSDRAQQILELERRRKEDNYRTGIDKHWSEKPLTAMRERDWRIFKEDFNIATKGGNLPNPMRNWEESGLSRAILDLVARVGYTDPSAIQRAAIPIALQNRDLIGVAVTGSGKTASFLLPMLTYISSLPRLDEFEWRRNDGPYAIILAPTRELAQQIESEARKFTSALGYTVVSIVGGHSIEEQSYALRNGAEIIIATPGRLVDMIERRILVLSQCCYIVMDEADRMIDLGFEEPVNKILDALPVTNQKPDDEDDSLQNPYSQPGSNPSTNVTSLTTPRYRQTMMYSATMPAAVERIAKRYLRRPAMVTIGNVGEAVDTVEQRVEFVSGETSRKKRLSEILHSGEFKAPIIVFVNIKRNCDAIARDIKHMGFSSVTLHGSKTQEQREAALLSLREGKTDVLVATDLAGRGIDVADVSLVVNFNMATNIESYTHRVGRTGRAGKSGVAITFLGGEDNDVLYDLRMMIGKSAVSRMPEELRRHEAAQQKRQSGFATSKDKGAGDGSGGYGGRGGR